ncbi:phosphate transport system regulatory protein PhoU [Halovivax ruber XH-70]|uniref:Phosphate-specific transport system accessory protein PhoU n=1 Tax=Halovivax ruber (strain DSM 18193 / JCM 13892 / XH-70) TaxID=797302 RepID=L0IAR8_HALRX|nr:phosphate signaling complex protein PhoU [Halovivax ruber]AGB15311.1 phosphate transport system regulatory protein PhoU [Halovivax ruber XH-70]
MSRNSYQDDLDRLRSDVLTMSDLVCDRLRLALDAFESRDGELAQRVVTGDHEINDQYLDIEGDCIDLLALQQPVASDLRFVVASFKIITDLERIADLATNLAQYTLDADRVRFPEIDAVRIGEATVEMVEDAAVAYAEGDGATPREIAARDDEIDDRCRRANEVVVRNLLSAGVAVDAPESVEPVLADVSRVLLTIRDLERVGDHAVNIAARTLYMVENDDELLY